MHSSSPPPLKFKEDVPYTLEVSSGPKYFGLTRNQSPKPGFGPGVHEKLCDISGSGFSGLSKTSSGLDGLLNMRFRVSPNKILSPYEARNQSQDGCFT
jgi:hypothetical protein